MKIMLFLGSGISLPTWKNTPGEEDIPDVNGITKAVLEGAWKFNKNTNVFEPRGHGEPSCPDAECCQTFLQRLSSRVSPFYEAQRGPANYEDLFYITDQIRNTVLNPLIQLTVEKMRIACKDLSQQSSVSQSDEFDTLCGRACNFIQCAVWKQLNRDVIPHRMDLIRSIVAQASKASIIKEVVICTLNHDLLVEKLLHQEKVDYNDGFGKPSEGGLFDPAELRVNAPIRLLKLHGSIDWFRYQRREGEHLSDHYVVKKAGWKPPVSANGIKWLEDDMPSALNGSYNKTEAYGTGIFKEFMHAFHSELSNHTLIVMSGYGWGDYAINQRLCGWLSQHPSHRIILLHRDRPCSTLASGHVIRHHWKRFIRLRKIVVIRKWLEDMPTWSEIEDHLERIKKLPSCKPPTPLNIF